VRRNSWGGGWGGMGRIFQSGDIREIIVICDGITNNHNHNDSNINHQLLVIIGDYW